MKDILDEAIDDMKEEKKLKRLKIFLFSVVIITVIGIVTLFIYDRYMNSYNKNVSQYTEILFDLSKHKSDKDIYKKQLDILLNQNNKKIQELALLDAISNSPDNNELNHYLDMLINGDYSENSTKLAYLSKFALILDKMHQEELNKQDLEFANKFLNLFNQKSEALYNKAMIYKALWYINKKDFLKAQELLHKIKDNDKTILIDKINADCILSNLEVESSQEKK
jgi:hypothetical protein